MGPAELLVIVAIVVGLWLFASTRASRSVDRRRGVEGPHGRDPRPWWLNPWVLVAVQLGLAGLIFVVTRGRLLFLVFLLPTALLSLGLRRTRRSREPSGDGQPRAPEAR